MQIPGKPIDEAERVAALRRYHILDTLPEEDYDNLTQLAAYICQTPVALITLLDDDRQWFKSAQGTDMRETPRDIALCAHSILDPSTSLVVEDLRLDARFAGNPLVTEDPRIVFYAGVPIVDEGGHALGTLCVLDLQARQLSDEQLKALNALTKQVMNLLSARKINQERATSEARFRSLVEEAPMATCLFLGRELTIAVANEPMLQSWGKTQAVIGKTLREAMPELEGQRFFEILDRVFTTGEPYNDTAAPVIVEVDGKLVTRYFNYTVKALRNEGGEIYGIIKTNVVVTDQVLARQRIEASQRDLLALFEQSPVALATIKREQLTFTSANNFYAELVGRKPEDIIGKPLAEALPEITGQGFDTLLNGVLDTGVPFLTDEIGVELLRDGKLESVYVNLAYQPMRDEQRAINSILVVATDVTPQVASRKQIQASEARFRSLVEEAPVATCLFVGRELRIEVANEQMLDLWGKGDAAIGKPLAVALPELKGQPFLDILDEIFTTGQPYAATNARCELVINGVLETRYFDFTYKPLRDEAGEVYGIMDMAVDVTEQVTARRLLEEKELELRNAIEVAELGTWKVEVATGTTELSQQHAAMFGLDTTTLSYEAALAVVHPDDHERVRAAFERAMAPESDGRYEAEYRIVNARNGRQQVIHAQGETAFDIAGKAVRISGICRDITMQRELQTALENEVQQRTEEIEATNEELEESNRLLAHSNDELAQYAYVASHDLQEPLRKIRIFTGLVTQHPELPESVRRNMDKISSSAERMSLLIQDLLAFSRLLRSDTLMRPVPLQSVMINVENDFELMIQEKGATISVGDLPVIDAVSLQMNQLFYNLIGNALKFMAPGRSPHISVASEEANAEVVSRYISKPLPFARYHHITVADNGIGFDTHYNEQIFEVFKRLHSRDSYAGSGIGLSICRRIVANHHGHLYATSESGKGSTFHILLPDHQQDEVSQYAGEAPMHFPGRD